MLIPLTNRQQKLIVNNVLRACQDITKLNSTGYNYLYLASGFIAHYNLQGFIDYYSSVDLKEDILKFESWNMWTNFHPGQENYEYYMSEKAVYQAILEGLKNE
jgi:hypothetical protein